MFTSILKMLIWLNTVKMDEKNKEGGGGKTREKARGLE